MLLELAGQVVQQQHGYWVEIHAWRVEATPVVPHGIRYALTLHEPAGNESWDTTMPMQPSRPADSSMPDRFCLMTISTTTFPTKARHTHSMTPTNCCRIFSWMWIEY